MDPVSAARLGVVVNREAEQHDRETVHEANKVFENEAYKAAREKVRNIYLDRLAELRPDQDLERYRLVEALKIIGTVEKHIRLAYNDAETNLQKAATRDFKEKRGLFKT